MALTKVSRGLLTTSIVDNGNATAITIDSSENVGIATVPKAGWVTDALQLGTNLSLSEDANSAYLSANAYNSSTGWKRVNNQLAGYIRMGTNDGIFSFSNAVTGAADSAITWQERIHVNASGNVGFATVPSAWRTAYPDKALDLGTHSALYDQFGGSTFFANNFYRSNDNSFKYKTTAGATAISLDAGQIGFLTAPSGTAGATATLTQHMTLSAAGNLLVGTTSSSGDTANDNPVVAGNFTTKYGITSIASVNTWTTVHTFGSNQGNFMVSMRASGTGNTAHNSVSIVAINQSATTSASLLSGSAVQIRIVGLSLQVLQNVFAGANINWSIMSIGN